MKIIFVVPSYNQPKLCSNATWNPNATTFATRNITGLNPYAIFSNKNGTIYVVNQQYGRIAIWLNNSIDPNIILYNGLSSPTSIFVIIHGDIYVDNSLSVNRIVKSVSYTNMSIPVMNISTSCYGLFVDISNTLYCSIRDHHQVLTKWLNDNTSTVTTVAGNGSPGSSSNMLYSPYGIFVDTNFDLYVADSYNHRIQLFRLGELNGITVAVNGSLNTTIILNRPSGVVLDGNKYLFITDCDSHRVIGSDKNGFRCIVGCSGSTGSLSNQLIYPQSLAFDSSGNIYIVDRGNHRIQKFTLFLSSCNGMIVKKIFMKAIILTLFLYLDQTTTVLMPTTDLYKGLLNETYSNSIT